MYLKSAASMKPPFVAAFLLFTMAVRVNDHQDENDKSADHQHDEDRVVSKD
jgi:hypothetical protein